MPGERDAENLRVALMSYDDRELRIRKFYLEEQSTIIRCTCFQSGEPVLQALRQERCFDVLVLSSQLEDMDSLTFLEKLNRLPSHPPLLLQGDGWADDITAAHLQPGSRFYGVGHDHLRDLLRGLLGVPGRNSMQIERFCTHLYELWKLPQPDTNCEYLTLAVQIACSADGKLALRKEILQGVAEQYHITVAAVDSGLRRLVEGLETRHPVEWEHFKAENGLTGSKSPPAGWSTRCSRPCCGAASSCGNSGKEERWICAGRTKRDFRKNSWKQRFCTHCACWNRTGNIYRCTCSR